MGGCRRHHLRAGGHRAAAPHPSGLRGSVRQALRGLTTRGRAFVAAGITASLCALLLGQKDLLRVGILLVALPLVAALVVGRTRLRLQVRRSLTPVQVPVGTPGDGRACPAATRAGCRPGCCCSRTGFLMYWGTGRGSWSTGSARTGAVPSTIRSSRDVRGLFQVGPLMLTVADPFGLVETSRTFTAQPAPAGHAAGLPAARASGSAPTGPAPGENRPRAIAAGRRGGRHRPRVPRRRRPAPGALALDRAARLADGAPGGAALAEPVRDVPGRADHLAPRVTARRPASSGRSARPPRSARTVIRRGYVDHPAGRSDHAVRDHPPYVGRGPPAADPTAAADRVRDRRGAQVRRDRPAADRRPAGPGTEPGDRDRRRRASSDDISALNRWRTNQATGFALLIDAASWAYGAEATARQAGPAARADRRHRARAAPERLAGRAGPAR